MGFQGLDRDQMAGSVLGSKYQLETDCKPVFDKIWDYCGLYFNSNPRARPWNFPNATSNKEPVSGFSKREIVKEEGRGKIKKKASILHPKIFLG